MIARIGAPKPPERRQVALPGACPNRIDIRPNPI